MKKFFLIAFLLLIPFAAAVEPTVDQTSTNTGFDSTYNHSHTVSTGANLILVAVGMVDPGSNKNVSSITYDGVPLSRIIRVASAEAVELWYLTNPNVGAGDVIVNINGGSNNRVLIGTTSWFDVDPNDPFGENKSSSGSGTTPSISINSDDVSKVFDFVATAETSTLTPDSEQTERFNGDMQTSSQKAGGSTEPGATTTTLSWTLGSSKTWVQAAVSIHGDEAGPVYFNVTAFPGVIRQNETVNLTSNVIDSSDISSVTANITAPDGQLAFKTLKNVTQTFWFTNFTANRTTPEGRYNVTFISTDEFGNIGTNKTYFFVDNQPPEVVDVLASPASSIPSSVINLSADVTDTFQVDKVFANITAPNGSQRTISLLKGSVYSGLYSETGVSGVYDVLFFANDSAGRINNTESIQFTIADLTSTMVSPLANVNRFPGENFTLTCNASVQVSTSFNVTLSAQFDNGSGFAPIPTSSGDILQANQSSLVCGTLNSTLVDSCQRDFLISTNLASADVRFRCNAEDSLTNISSITRTVDIIQLFLSLDKNKYSIGESSVASANSNAPNAPYTIRWFNSTGGPLNGSACFDTGTTPSSANQTFLESCQIPDAPDQNNSKAVLYINNDPSRNVSVLFNISFVDPLEYIVTDIFVGLDPNFLEHVQSVVGTVVDNESEPAVNECCKVHIDDANSGLPVFVSDVLRMDGGGECRASFLLDSDTFFAPQDYSVDIDTWQCSDEDLPAKNRKRGLGGTSFTVEEHIRDNVIPLPIVNSSTLFSGLDSVRVLHNLTNVWGEPMRVIWTAYFAKNKTEADYVYPQYVDLIKSVDSNTSITEYVVNIPSELPSGSYRLEFVLKYLDDVGVVHETDIVRSEPFVVIGVNETFIVNELFMKNSDGNRTSESSVASLGSSPRPRLFLTEGLPFSGCINYTNNYNESLDVSFLNFNLHDAFTNSIINIPFEEYDSFTVPVGTNIACALSNLPLDIAESDSCRASLKLKLSGAGSDQIVKSFSDYFYIDSIENTLYSPDFYIYPNSTFAGFPGVWVRDNDGRDVPVFNDVETKLQSEIPWGFSEICSSSTGDIYSCNYTNYLSAGSSFSVCFAMQNFLDSTRFINLVELRMEEESTGFSIDYSDEIPMNAFRYGYETGILSTYDILGNTASFFGITRSGYSEVCTGAFTIPEDIVGSNAWDVSGVIIYGDRSDLFWRFNSQHFTIAGQENKKNIIDINEIIFNTALKTPSQEFSISLNITSFVEVPVPGLVVGLGLYDVQQVAVSEQTEYSINLRPGSHMYNLTLKVPSTIQHYPLQPYHVQAQTTYRGETYTRDSISDSRTFNVSNLLFVNTITDKQYYFVDEKISICANVTNHILSERIPIDVYYAYRCGGDAGTGRSLLGSHTESHGISANTTQNQCHEFTISSLSAVELGINNCYASTKVTATNGFDVVIPTTSPSFNITDPIKLIEGVFIGDTFFASFNVSGPAVTRDLSFNIPPEFADVALAAGTISATLDGSPIGSGVLISETGIIKVYFEDVALTGAIQELNATIYFIDILPHNITSSLNTFQINSTTPLNITYNITLASGESFSNGELRGVVFIYEFISNNGTGTFVDQDDFDGIITPLIKETTVTVGTPTQRTVSISPKLQPGTYAVVERIRLKDKVDVVFRQEVT